MLDRALDFGIAILVLGAVMITCEKCGSRVGVTGPCKVCKKVYESPKLSEQEYIAKISAWSRKDILRVCRAAGITAHSLKTNEDLARLLWNAVGKR
jgi:hypothetical protein